MIRSATLALALAACALVAAPALARVEAGHQGEHKLARGYEPVAVYSAHHIASPGLRRAVADYLERERAMVDHEIAALGDYTPFRKG